MRNLKATRQQLKYLYLKNVNQGSWYLQGEGTFSQVTIKKDPVRKE